MPPPAQTSCESRPRRNSSAATNPEDEVADSRSARHPGRVGLAVGFELLEPAVDRLPCSMRSVRCSRPLTMLLKTRLKTRPAEIVWARPELLPLWEAVQPSPCNTVVRHRCPTAHSSSR